MGATEQHVYCFVKKTRADAEKSVLYFRMKRRYPGGSEIFQ